MNASACERKREAKRASRGSSTTRKQNRGYDSAGKDLD